jgi:chitinase
VKYSYKIYDSADISSDPLKSDDRLIFTFHYYNSNVNSIAVHFQEVADWALDNDIPVLVGEFGQKNEVTSSDSWYKKLHAEAKKHAFAVSAWDTGVTTNTGFMVYDRTAGAYSASKFSLVKIGSIDSNADSEAEEEEGTDAEEGGDCASCVAPYRDSPDCVELFSSPFCQAGQKCYADHGTAIVCYAFDPAIGNGCPPGTTPCCSRSTTCSPVESIIDPTDATEPPPTPTTPATPAPTATPAGDGAEDTQDTSDNTAVGTAGSSPSTGGKFIIGYYTNWAQYRNGRAKFVPTDIDASLMTHICYAFAMPSATYDIVPFEWNDVFDPCPAGSEGASWCTGMYQKFHNHVRAQNPTVKTLISLGGWTFNEKPATKKIFTTMVKTYTTRRHFILSCIAFARKHSFDGVDIDWEYPGHVGQGGEPTDKDQFTQLLEEFRAAIQDDALDTGLDELLLTIAVGAGESTVTGGYDVANIHPHLDWIGVMSYDLHGAWEAETGFHTGLYAADSGDKLSVSGGKQVWLDGGAPANKLVLGVGSYGRGWTLTAAAAAAKTGVGAAAHAQSPAAKNGPSTNAPGFLSYYEIENMLNTGGKAYFDSVRDGMYVIKGDQWVGYDNEATVTTKCEFALANSYAGVMMWAIDLDRFYEDAGLPTYPLLRAVAAAMDDGTAGGENNDAVDNTNTTPDDGGNGGSDGPGDSPFPINVFVPHTQQVLGFPGVNGVPPASLRQLISELATRSITPRGISLTPAASKEYVDALFQIGADGADPEAPSATEAGRVCQMCKDAAVGPCKRLSDSTCWEYVGTSETCPLETTPCAAPEDVLQFTLDLPTSVLDSRMDEAVLMALLVPILKQMLCQLLALTSCDDVFSINILSVAAPEDGDRASSSLRSVSFYVVQDNAIYETAAAVTVAAEEEVTVGNPIAFADGTMLVGVTTQAAGEGPLGEFDCQTLGTNDCATMTKACDGLAGWCRGPAESLCDQQTTFEGAFPPSTIVHGCSCVESSAVAKCFFQSATHAISWTVDQRHPAYVVNEEDVIDFSFSSPLPADGSSEVRPGVWSLPSVAAFASCNFVDASLLDDGSGSSFAFTATRGTSDQGSLYFADKTHCESGVKLELYVKETDFSASNTGSEQENDNEGRDDICPSCSFSSYRRGFRQIPLTVP